MSKTFRAPILLPGLLLCLLFAACNSANPPSSTGSPATQSLPTPVEVTATPPSVIARVNGEEITSEDLQVQFDQIQAAQEVAGTELATDDVQQTVLDDMVDRLLLAQGARADGFTVDDVTLDQRLAALIEQAGGQDSFDQWLSQYGYTADLFRRQLRSEMEAAYMRDQITNAVPTSAEQVEARQLLFSDDFSAERVLAQMENGTSFETAVINNDPQRLGYLGWFPRGYLLQPEVEEAAFALQPGEHSDVIETDLGFHIVEVLDRDPDRPLSPQARLQLQLAALQDWLTAQRAQAQIEYFLP